MKRNGVALGLACLASLATSACMDKEGKVRENLVAFGLPEPAARCMARPLARDLSVAQLKQLGGLVKAVRDRGREGGITVLLRELGRMGDPEIPVVVGRAAVKCTFGH